MLEFYWLLLSSTATRAVIFMLLSSGINLWTFHSHFQEDFCICRAHSPTPILNMPPHVPALQILLLETVYYHLVLYNFYCYYNYYLTNLIEESNASSTVDMKVSRLGLLHDNNGDSAWQARKRRVPYDPMS